MSDEQNLAENFAAIGLPQPAAAWLLDLWTVIQVLDDAMDGDRAAPAEVDRAITAIFLTMPGNDFYRQYSSTLQTVVWLMVLKWRGANALEADGQADERTYMARAGFYDVVTMVCHICGVADPGRVGVLLYGETFADYIAEWRAA